MYLYVGGTLFGIIWSMSMTGLPVVGILLQSRLRLYFITYSSRFGVCCIGAEFGRSLRDGLTCFFNI